MPIFMGISRIENKAVVKREAGFGILLSFISDQDIYYFQDWSGGRPDFQLF